MYLNGATSVTCIEPRKQLADGINRFAQMHNLPITAINNLHSCIFSLDKVFDTTVMLGVDDLIPDILTFLNNLRNISNFLILKTKSADANVSEKSINLVVENNLHHRQGFNINTNSRDFESLGYQTTIKNLIENPKKGRFIRFLYGKNFYETIFDYLDYEIMDCSIYNDSVSNFNVYSIKIPRQS